MVQKIKQGNIFGRIGTGFGKGLAEQIPKEIERNRLQSGLEDVANQSEGLTPFQRFAKLSGVPGITPQAIQSGSELLRQEGIRSSFRNPTGQGQPAGASAQSPTMDQGQSGMPAGIPNQSPDKINRSVVQGEENIPTNFATRGAEAETNQGLVKENPSQQKFIPPIPWSPQERDDDLYREGQRHPELSFEQLQQRVADNERRYLEAPEAYREQQKYLKVLEDEADAEFDNQLETILQKKGNEIYGDLTGETLLDTKKAMRKDLATNPKLTPRTAAEKWVKKGKDFATTKRQIQTLANRDLWDSFAPGKKESTLKTLKSAQKSYDEMGRKKEFYDMLRSKNTPDGGYGFDASPAGAALIAYPRSDSVKQIVQSAPFRKPGQAPLSSEKESRKIADEFAKKRTNSDSILAFVREMKDNRPYFDEITFLDYLRDNQKEFAFSPDQVNELNMPYSDYHPNWGDLALFPYFGKGSAVHD